MSKIRIMMKAGSGKSDASLRQGAVPNPNLNHNADLCFECQTDEVVNQDRRSEPG
jgi:hypothetical protein